MTCAYAFFIINGAIVLSSLLNLRRSYHDRLFAFSLARVLVALPLLCVLYLWLFLDPIHEFPSVLVFSESVFGVAWIFMAQRLHLASGNERRASRWMSLSEFLTGSFVAFVAWGYAASSSAVGKIVEPLVIPLYGIAYFFSLALLLSMLFMAWRLEGFWRGALPARRWEYRFLVVGAFLVCCVFIWSGSYRLVYLRLPGHHLLLMPALLAVCWLMIVYGVARYRLLSRKMFVSREVVYVSFAPILFGVYLLGLGAVGMMTRYLGWPHHSVLLWFLASLGFGALVLYFSSERLRRKVLYFITTNFYVNKHNYRKEWLALSGALQGAFSEDEILKALTRSLSDAFYTSQIRIWIRGADGGFRLCGNGGREWEGEDMLHFDEPDPLIHHLRVSGYFTLEDVVKGREWLAAAERWEEPLRERRLVLVAPLLAGEEILGIVGLGAEYTGGKYWQDDFDLLQAAGSQTATAILAARRAEALARLKQREVWNALSAFVLHDIKNAAAMLSLVRKNAGEHLQDPEFQEDMLEAIDNALGRMGKVQTHLGSVRDETGARWETIEFRSFLREFVERVSNRFGALDVTIECPEHIDWRIDPGLLWTILENLLLNSLEAGGEGTRVNIRAFHEDSGLFRIEVQDDGPGIAPELLPYRVFEPFETRKAGGTGIGMWQVKTLVERLGGRIHAGRGEAGGSRIVMEFIEGLPGSGAE